MILSRLLRLSVALFVSSAVLVVNAIYPDDHWNFSTKLTTSNYAETIQSAIDGGKTVFVRFIASEVSYNIWIAFRKIFQISSQMPNKHTLYSFCHFLVAIAIILSSIVRDEGDDESRLRPGMRLLSSLQDLPT